MKNALGLGVPFGMPPLSHEVLLRRDELLEGATPNGDAARLAESRLNPLRTLRNDANGSQPPPQARRSRPFATARYASTGFRFLRRTAWGFKFGSDLWSSLSGTSPLVQHVEGLEGDLRCSRPELMFALLHAKPLVVPVDVVNDEGDGSGPWQVSEARNERCSLRVRWRK